MTILYRIYQWLIAAPILLILTAITALTTIIGTAFGKRSFWGYWPAHFWSRCVCSLWLVKVKVVGRERINKDQSYVFVANHKVPLTFGPSTAISTITSNG